MTAKKWINDKDYFISEVRILLKDPRIKQMHEYPQHGITNTLDHSLAVAKKSFMLAEKLGWKIDERELARGALLHDYYLYDIKEEGYTAYHHGTSHPQLAMENALKDFGLSDKEKNIIKGHMWPLTFRNPPKNREAILVCLADKQVAFDEMILKKGLLKELTQ